MTLCASKPHCHNVDNGTHSLKSLKYTYRRPISHEVDVILITLSRGDSVRDSTNSVTVIEIHIKVLPIRRDVHSVHDSTHSQKSCFVWQDGMVTVCTTVQILKSHRNCHFTRELTMELTFENFLQYLCYFLAEAAGCKVSGVLSVLVCTHMYMNIDVL